MAKPKQNDLNFGHFGRATYDSENQTWLFDRRSGPGEALQQLGSWKTTLSPSKAFSAGSSAWPPPTLRDMQQAVKTAIRDNPDLAPSIDLLPRLALVSTTINTTTEAYEPAIGNVLDFGSITSGQHKNQRRVAGTVTGETGNILRLSVLVKERQGWESDRSIWIEGFSLGDGESGYWVGDAVPIQQVCFAQSEDRSAFLAIRSSTGTTLCRPLHHDRPKSAKQSRFYELPPSRLDPNPMLSVSPDQSGGAPHADVTFNPDYQRQFGVIDQKSHWSIWDIEAGYKQGSKYTVSCTVLGQIGPPESELQEQEVGAREDGWARILWVGDVSTIFVSNRRRMEVIDIRGGQAVRLVCPQLIPSRSADWILDVKQHPTNQHRLFVLTSTRLTLMAVVCPNDRLEYSDSSPGANVLISWTHFRGVEDISLKLSLSSGSDDVSRILLYSHLNALITVFEFVETEVDFSTLCSGSDPVALHLDDLLVGTQMQRHITQLQLESLQYREDARLRQEGPGTAYMADDVRFFRLSVVLSDLSVHQILLYSQALAPEGNTQALPHVEAPSWTTVIQPRTTGPQSSDLVEPEDDFVAPDGTVRLSTPVSRSSTRWARPIVDRLPSQSEQQRDTLLLDYTCMYDALVCPEVAHASGQLSKSQTEDVVDVIEKIESLLAKSAEHDETPYVTMLEKAELTIKISDMDNASTRLRDLLAHKQDASLAVERLAPKQVLHLSHTGDQEPSISSLYDTVLDSWIAPLPTTISSRVRQSKERLTRRIAAEVMLASSWVRHTTSLEVPIPSIQLLPRASPESIAPFPILPRGGDNSSSQDEPPLSRPESSINSSDYPAQSSPPLHTTLTRLGQYLQISKPIPDVTSNIKQVLMHWAPGTDPGAYDWNVTTRHVQDELQVDDEDSRRRKGKQKRKAERLLKRQRRERELEQKQKAESQPLFGRDLKGLRSSPAPMVGMGMSSQVQSQSQPQSEGLGRGMFGIVQSQVEAGRHGGRPPIKKKKGKGRVSGF